MSDAPVHVLVAAFDTPIGASSMVQTLEAASAVGIETIQDAAVITRDADGKLHVEEPADWGGGKGAVVGGVVGAALGLLAGPVGWAAGLGALVGGLAAKLRDSGFSDDRLRALGESLQPGASILVVVVEERWAPALEQQLVEAGAVTVHEEIGAELARQIEAQGGRSRRRRRSRSASNTRYF